MKKENEFPMNCVYASPEVMRKQPQTKPEAPKPYPIVHAEPSRKPDRIPMGCVYASPDMIAGQRPVKPTPVIPTPPRRVHNPAFCQFCGMSTSIEMDPDQTIQFCMTCGQSIPLEAKFCPFCGHNTRLPRPTPQPSAGAYAPPTPTPVEQTRKRESVLSKFFKRGR